METVGCFPQCNWFQVLLCLRIFDPQNIGKTRARHTLSHTLSLAEVLINSFIHCFNVICYCLCFSISFIYHRDKQTYVIHSVFLKGQSIARSHLCLSVFQVDKVCGHSSNASSTTVRTFPPTSVTPPPANSSQDVPGDDKIGMLAHLHRLGWIPRHIYWKTHFTALWYWKVLR